MLRLAAIALLMLGGLVMLVIVLRQGAADASRVEQRLVAAVRREAMPATAPTGLPLPEWLETYFWRADIDARQALVIWAAVVVGLPPIGYVVGGTLVAVLVFLTAAAAGPMLLIWRCNSQRRKMQEALPGFVERLRQHIQTGASVQQALRRANATSPPVLHEIFSLAERRVHHGAGLGETLESLARRQALPELALLASAVAASLRFGGRLSDTLGSLAQSMRDRQRVERELDAATSEVRASTLVLSLIVPGAGAATMFINPDNLAWFLDPERGRTMLYVIICLYLGGLYMLRRISKVIY